MAGHRASEESTLSYSGPSGDRLASVGILAAGLAHELNNPIGSILLAARNAKAHPDRSDECLDTILRNARRCAAVVRNVLAVSRSEPAHARPLEVNAVVERAVRSLDEAAAERRASIEVRLAADLPLVHANALELEQALRNLLSNAIQSAESGVQVRVATSDRNGTVIIVVADDGRGVPAELRERLFDPFFTTRQDEGGMGLGLSLVRAIAQGFSGSVEFVACDGAGAEVELTIPATSTGGGA